MSEAAFWLVKSEPDCFSIDDLARAPRRTTAWSGVRNYQARNFMRQMQPGELVLYYHSSAAPPAVVGLARVARAAYPDHTAWDKTDEHFDAKASAANPIWDMVDIEFVEKFAEPLPLEVLRPLAALKHMELLRRGSRLSVQSVRPAEFAAVVALAKRGSGESVAKSKDKSKVPAKRVAREKPPADLKPSRAKARR